MQEIVIAAWGMCGGRTGGDGIDGEGCGDGEGGGDEGSIEDGFSSFSVGRG